MFDTPTTTHAPMPATIEASLLAGPFFHATSHLSPAALAEWIAAACNEFADRREEDQQAAINAWRACEFEKELRDLRAVDLSKLPVDLARRHREALADAEKVWAGIARWLDGEQRMVNPAAE